MAQDDFGALDCDSAESLTYYGRDYQMKQSSLNIT